MSILHFRVETDMFLDVISCATVALTTHFHNNADMLS